MGSPCSKCGSTDIPKYTRLRKDRRKRVSIAGFCVICHSEDQKGREARRYDKKLAYNRLWCKGNRKVVNAYKRRDYWKKKKGTWQDRDSVEWYKQTDNQGFSKMTYTPLYPGYT